MIPSAPALGPSTMCSLTITASNPASSATTAISTSPRRSRGGVSVQFSLRTRTSLMSLSAAPRQRAPRQRRPRRVGAARAPGPGCRRGRRTDRRYRPTVPKRLDHREPAERHVAGRVAAFVRGDEPSVTQSAGHVEQALGHRAKCSGGKQHPPEWIERTRIEAARDQDELGRKCLERRDDDAVDRVEVRTRARARRERNVEGRACSLTRPGLAQEPRARGVEPILVQRDREHRGVEPEDRLGAVAVVHVPVDDSHPTEAARCLGMPNRRRRRSRRGRNPSPGPVARGGPGDERGRRRWSTSRSSTASIAVIVPPAASCAIGKEPLPNGASLPASPPRPVESSRMRST